MVRWRSLLVAVLFLVLLSQPVLAQGSEGGRVAFGQDVTITSDEHIAGDVVAFGGSVTLQSGSTVSGSVVSLGGDIDIAGRVDGNVVSIGGDVLLRESALVSGNAMATNGVTRSPGAIVRGQVGDMRGGVSLPPIAPSLPTAPRLWWTDWNLTWPWHSGLFDLFNRAWQSFLGTLTMLALGVVVVLLVPGLTRTAGHTLVGYPGQSTAVGLLTWLVAALALPLLIIICIGIPVAMLGATALAIAAAFGWIVAGLALGERLLDALKQADRQPVLSVAVGLIVLAVLSAIPCLGFLVTILVATWGLGAVVLTRFGTTPYAPTSVAAPVAPLPPVPPVIPAPAAPSPEEPPTPANQRDT